ncbi:MAG: transglycosylase SLT domain-containing protein, partial [Legionella sp.]|uniref:transglycosylase SLT domain-containing protein n=1 Tax=Legionella sp. TaxID=459 RepID=UPI002851BA13|nr:transglycosylase SLT domain-containing protein [Legionella sp.]
IRRHQHFDWTELGVATLTGGLIGSKAGENLSKKLENLDNHTGMLRAELQTLAGAGAQSLTTGTHFDALQVLGDNFGSTIGNAVVGRFAWPGLEDRVKDLAKENIKGLEIDDLLTDWENYKKLNNWDDTIEDFKRDLAQPIVTPFYEYSSTPDAEQYSAIPEAERACTIPPRNEGHEFSSISNPQVLTSVWNNEKMRMSIKGSTLTPELANLHSLLEPSLTAELPEGYSSIPKDDVLKNSSGKYNIDYNVLVIKEKGGRYRNIASNSYYLNTPGSPIAGDASDELKIKSVDAIITAAIENNLNLHETAHVLAIAHQESMFNPYAAAGTTSASGLGQFINETGERYDIDDANRWDITTQANALVNHFLDNKFKINSLGFSEEHIYRLHHDGSNSTKIIGSEGLATSRTKVIPMIKVYEDAIRKIF